MLKLLLLTSIDGFRCHAAIFAFLFCTCSKNRNATLMKM